MVIENDRRADKGAGGMHAGSPRQVLSSMLPGTLGMSACIIATDCIVIM